MQFRAARQAWSSSRVARWLPPLGAGLAVALLVLQTVQLGHAVHVKGFTGAWDSWVNNQQWFFQTGIVWGVIALVVRRPGIGALGWGAVAAFSIASHGVIDQVLHQWLVNHRVYAAFGQPQLAANPQYTKLLFYLVEVPWLLLWCVRRRTRTLQRGFILLQMGAILLTTMAFHLTLPGGALRDYREERVFDVRTVLAADNPHDFAVGCQALGLLCRTEPDPHDPTMMPSVREKMVGLAAYARAKTRNGYTMHAPVVLNEGALNSTNEFVAYVAGGVLRDDGHFWVAVDQDRVNLSWKNTEAYFSFLGWVAHGFWTLLAAFLIVFHDRRFRRRALARAAEREALLARARTAGAGYEGVDHGPW